MSLELDRALTALRPLERVEIDEWTIDIKALSELIAVPRERIKPKKFVSRKGTYK